MQHIFLTVKFQGMSCIRPSLKSSYYIVFGSEIVYNLTFSFITERGRLIRREIIRLTGVAAKAINKPARTIFHSIPFTASSITVRGMDSRTTPNN